MDYIIVASCGDVCQSCNVRAQGSICIGIMNHNPPIIWRGDIVKSNAIVNDSLIANAKFWCGNNNFLVDSTSKRILKEFI